MASMKRSTLLVGILLVVGVGSWFVPVRAQAMRSDDVLPALLTEVRGLRAAMEQMASGSTQAQLLVGRLQLQEGRVTSMIRRLDGVHDSLATVRGEYEQLRATRAVRERELPGGMPPEEKESLLAVLTAQEVAAKAGVERLSAEEAQLAADIAVEQQRWTAINQRLDELERSLTKR
jgi:tetrahydromethanopterin S-methyltransferase subunit G